MHLHMYACRMHAEECVMCIWCDSRIGEQTPYRRASAYVRVPHACRGMRDVHASGVINPNSKIGDQTPYPESSADRLPTCICMCTRRLGVINPNSKNGDQTPYPESSADRLPTCTRIYRVMCMHQFRINPNSKVEDQTPCPE